MGPANATTVLVLAAPGTEQYWRRTFRGIGHEVDLATSPKAAVCRLEQRREEVSVVIVASAVGLDDGGTLAAIYDVVPNVSVILSLSDRSKGSAAARLHPDHGIHVLNYPPTPEDLQKAIESTFADTGLTKSSEEPKVPRTAAAAAAFMGQSAGMEGIASLLPQIAWADVPVLIQGETGSGKEVIAREIHSNSQRARKPFYKLNCAALPSELVESELFGYERGAFTGAFQRKAGIFELADGGTLLLDEIGDMDVRLQAKLLQVLQDHSFQRIGGRGVVTVDVRVIAATHQDLEKNIEAGTFREDLYYRLNVLNIVVPPLRERKVDLFHLTEVLLRKHAAPGAQLPILTPALMDVMMEWDWPGNVRELENFARRLLIFRDCDYLARDLNLRSERVRSTRSGACREDANVAREDAPSWTGPYSEPANAAVPLRGLERVTAESRRIEKETIISALNATRWNRRRTAGLLSIDYKALLYKMKKLGIDSSEPSIAEAEEPMTRTAAAGAFM